MDLIDDLGTDLALAFLVERKYRQKIDSEDIPPLIRRVRAALLSVAQRQNLKSDNATGAEKNRAVSPTNS